MNIENLNLSLETIDTVTDSIMFIGKGGLVSKFSILLTWLLKTCKNLKRISFCNVNIEAEDVYLSGIECTGLKAI